MNDQPLENSAAPEGCAAPTGSPRRWMISYLCWNDQGELQTSGAHFYDGYPPDSEVAEVQKILGRENIWARAFRLEVRPAN